MQRHKLCRDLVSSHHNHPLPKPGGVTKAAKGPVNEMYKIDFSDKATGKCTKIEGGKMQPGARWHHTATFDGRNTIIIFGGYTADFR